MSNLRLVDGINGRSFIVDKSTGEVLSENGVDGKVVFSTTRHKIKDDFVILPQAAVLSLLEMGLTKEQMNVFFAFLSTMKFENWVDVSQAQIAKLLKIHPVNVSNAVKVLHQKGLMETITDDQNFLRKRLSALYCWRGDAKQRDEQISKVWRQMSVDSIR